MEYLKTYNLFLLLVVLIYIAIVGQNYFRKGLTKQLRYAKVTIERDM